MELRQYWQIILKRRKTLFKTIGIMVGLVILTSFLISPVYQFKCNVLLKTDDPKTILTGVPTELANLGAVSTDLVIFSQLAMIRNLSLIRDVIQRMGLKKSNNKPLSASEFLEPNSFNLLYRKKGVRMTQLPSSQIIQVSGYSNSPEEAVGIANEVADSFVAFFNKSIQGRGQQALTFIQDSLPKLSADLKQAENELVDFKIANHLSNISYLREKLLTSLVNLQENKVTNETNIIDYEKRIAQVQEKLKKIPEFQRSSEEYHANATLEYIRQKLMDAESTLASSEVKTTPEYYGQKQSRASIDRLKDEYRKQASKLLYSETKSRNSIYTNLVQTLIENELNRAGAISKRQVVNQILLDKQKELDELTVKEAEMEPLQRKVNALQTAVANLLAKEPIAQLSSRLDLSNATVIERATLPPEPDQLKKFRWFPKRKFLTVLSFLFSIFLGLTIIFFQEYLDDSFTDPKAAEEYLQLPLLAVLPEFSPSEALNLTRLPTSGPWIQALWAVPDQIRPGQEKSPSGIISIISTAAGEGKSLVAASLSSILALRNLRVLLLDLNFFHPSLPSLYGLPPGPGVREILQGTASIEKCLKRIGSSEFYLLANGETDKVNWSELDVRALAEWLADVRRDYDVLVLDLPAVGAGEGAPLAALGDQTIMVVAASQCRRDQVAHAVSQIQRCQARIAGLVFNRYKELKLGSLLSPTITTAASWPPVQHFLTFVERHFYRRGDK
jgi:succinoglycan biosynthesis transport protein ExoP